MLGVYLFSSCVFDLKRLLIVYFENEFNKLCIEIYIVVNVINFVIVKYMII